MLSGICGERELMQYGERKERSARAEGCPVRREDDDLGVRVKEREELRREGWAFPT